MPSSTDYERSIVNGRESLPPSGEQFLEANAYLFAGGASYHCFTRVFKAGTWICAASLERRTIKWNQQTRRKTYNKDFEF
jgi:hypothetical protein